MNFNHPQVRENIIRWTFFIVGVMILGFGISMTMQVKDFGIGPWDVFHYGLFLKLGLTVGTWSIIAGLIIVILHSFYRKKLPQIGTILNMSFIGIFIDFFNWLLPSPEILSVQLVVFILGTVITASGIGIYVSSGIGAGPRDSLMLMISETMNWKVSNVRNGIEVTVALLGFTLGGPVGIGTVFIALFLGTFVGYTLPASQRLLQFLIMKGDLYEDIYQRPLRSNHND
ncbi:YczE/YyaS/YitT family protein [Halobacillus sp. K22]|uniref:YczE/YyaS/YitT family protein n=1 Tax=Halobacillus sp. K22 TaxID=3457431 RepID=UPI003FCE069D